MEASRRSTTIMVIVSIALHALAMVWLSVPEPAAQGPEEIGILVSMAAPPPEPEAAPEPEIQPEVKVVEAAVEPAPQPVVEPAAVEMPSPDAIPMLDEIEPRFDARPLEESPVPEPVQFEPVTDPAVAQTYEQQLLSWLNQYKQYPKLALRRGIEGDCVVRIVIDRSGRVQSSSLEVSSKNNLLDREALAMVERANPFPAPPQEVPGRTLEYVIPVSFDLQ